MSFPKLNKINWREVLDNLTKLLPGQLQEQMLEQLPKKRRKAFQRRQRQPESLQQKGEESMNTRKDQPIRKLKQEHELAQKPRQVRKSA